MTERVDLYRFVESRTGLIWTYTNSAVKETYDMGEGLETYFPVPMGRGNIEQKQEITKASLDIELDIKNDLSVKLLTAYTENVISLTVFTKRSSGTMVSWKGRLSGIKPKANTVNLVFESIFTSLQRAGLRARYQKSCRHALYGRGCWVNPEDFALATTLMNIDGRTLTVPGAATQPNGYYLGGMIAAADGALSFIVNHVGDKLTLQRVSYSLAQEFAASGPGNPVTIYPGCDHTLGTCWSKFNNGLNSGGFKWIPLKNPMGGSSIV